MTTRGHLIVGILIALILVGAGVYVAHYLGLSQAPLPAGVVKTTQRAPSTSQNSDQKPVNLIVEPVVTGLNVPWEFVFTSPDRMLITERPGSIRVFENGVLKPDPVYVFSDVLAKTEEGAMGMALDPHYADNHFVYAAYAYGSGAAVRVVRLTDQGDKLADQKTLIEGIPAASNHAGCRIKFGPDGKLYITTGDATNKNLPQDTDSLGGKILRINSDGSIPEDNPFNNAVWSYGHRNSQGIAWDPVTGEMYATENGQSGFDGPGGGDEINRIMAGSNYGWPRVSHEEKKDGTEAPLLLFTPAVAPSGATFYTGDKIPQFKNQFLFAALKGEGIVRVKFDPDNPDKVDEYEKLKEVNVGRIRDVVEGPDGWLYFATSNRDGRGKPQAEDDQIMRIKAQ